MRKHHLVLIGLACLCSFTGLYGNGLNTLVDDPIETHPNQYFVKLCHGISHQEIKHLMAELNSVELWKNDKIGLRLWAVKNFPYSCSDGEITDIDKHLVRSKKKTNIDDAALNMIFKLEDNDEDENDDEDSYFDNLDLRGPLGPNPIRIAILDSGISDEAILKNPNYSGPTFFTGYDYVNDDPVPNDEHGHGTHIAGIIYGIVSQLGTPTHISFDIRKTHNEDGLGSISHLISAIIDAVDNGADIINMSFSYYEMLDSENLNPLQLAIEYAEQHGVLVVASAGNQYDDNDSAEGVPVPATFPNDNIISVASNSPDEMLSYFSNFGANSVDVSILGEDIPGPGLYGENEYASGTSFSTAIVSALSAILGSRQDLFNACEIKCILISTSKPVPGWQDLNQAGGVIDFKKALKDPSPQCSDNCPNVESQPEFSCGANCPPETNDMDICVAAGITVVDQLLAYDAEQDAIAFTQDPVYGPFNGSVIIYPDGSFSYTSTEGKADMFVYQVCDGQVNDCSDGCNQGLVYINTAGCHPPSENGTYYYSTQSKVSDSKDDAEENANNGKMYLNSSDLEMTLDPTYIGANQIVGLRFQDIEIPQGATVANAVIRFVATDRESGSTSLLFKGHDTDTAPGFNSDNGNISYRPTTSASVSWENIPDWVPGGSYHSPDLSAIIQEIVDRPDWKSKNSLAIMISGSGERTAWSYDGLKAGAPELIVDYSLETEKATGDCVEFTDEDPRLLTFRYTGQGCSASDHQQDPGKVDCSGDPAFAPLVYVTAEGDKVYFADLKVPLNGTFSIDAASVGDDKLKSTTNLYLKDAQGNLMQTMEIHTSGSQPLGINDQFGSLVLEGYLSKTGITCGQPDQDISEIYDCCQMTDKQPTILSLEYTGEDCSASRHNQESGEISCWGDPEMANFVYITAKSGDDESKLFFSNLQVPLRGIFDIDAASIGEKKFESSVLLYIRDAQGNLLQQIEFQTSCSEPLGVGNQFGALRLKGYLAENGELCGDEPVSQICNPTTNCTAEGNRSAIGLMYLGSTKTTVEASEQSGGEDDLGSYPEVGPGDFVVFSALYRNNNELKHFFLQWSDGQEVEIPIETSIDILGNVYGEFKVVQQLDKEGNDCRIPYSSCIEVNRHCEEPETSPVAEEAVTLPSPLNLDPPDKQLYIEKNVELYPNPAQDVIYLDLKDFAGQAVGIRIYDSVAQLVKSFKVAEAGNSPIAIGLRDLPDGLYRVIVYPAGDFPVSKKLVISRG